MSEPRNIRVTAASTEHDWSRMPFRLRAAIAARVLLGRPFAVPGQMVIMALGATTEHDDGSRASLDERAGRGRK